LRAGAFLTGHAYVSATNSEKPEVLNWRSERSLPWCSMNTEFYDERVDFMDLRDFSDMGHEIKDIVQDAVDSMNFQQLNRDISRTVNNTFKNMGQSQKGFYYQPKDDQGRPIYASEQAQRNNIYEEGRYDNSKYNSKYENNRYDNSRYKNGTYRNGEAEAYGQRASDRTSGKNVYTYGYSGQNNRSRAGMGYGAGNMNPVVSVSKSDQVYDVGFPVLKNPPGKVASVLKMSLGYTFGAIFGITELVLLICGLVIHDASFPLFVTAAGLSPLFAASVAAAVSGTSTHGRIKRYKAYLKVLKGRTFASFRELTGQVGKSIGYVRRDVRWMIENGYFPEGHIDEQNTCVMVTNDIYRQYLETQKNVRENQASGSQTKGNQAKTGESGTGKATEAESAELRKIAEEGQRYMQRIREANDAIPDTEISNKLYRMELIVKKIFEYVAENPEQIPQLRRFMDYYMPTTDKLVSAYKEFDTQPIQGENIKNAKSEIAKTLDTINIAYEKLYDSMYKEAAMDVSSDIAVLQTLLAQEGLTENVFEKGAGKK